MRYKKTNFYCTGYGLKREEKEFESIFQIILADTYNRKGVCEEVVYEDDGARSDYNALVRYRRDNPDGRPLSMEKKRYGRRKCWTLLLNGVEYVAEENITELNDDDDNENRHWYFDETCNWKVGCNDGWD